MISSEVLFFAVFIILILSILIIDLKVIGRNSHVVAFKESIIWTCVWVALAVSFYFFLLYFGDKIHHITNYAQLEHIKNLYAPNLKLNPADFNESLQLYRNNMSMEYITGYIIEYTLSIDNVFVIMLILTAFSVKEKYYKKVLFWGILGAIVLRFVFIFTGSVLVQKFEWILLLFGAFLVYSGVKMFLNRNKDEKIEPQEQWIIKFISKKFNVYKRYVNGYFFVKNKRDHKIYLTPLIVVVIFVEFTDLVFALDSIPAIFSITIDPYIVFFSNIFAIIGLRTLFFMLSRVINMFHYLKIGISFLLFFVGMKLLFHTWLSDIGFQTKHSLYIILATFVISILFSIIFPQKNKVIIN